MNERITLLAIKASDPDTGWLDREKFAQLIVQECARQVTRNEALNIFEHFGVEH